MSDVEFNEEKKASVLYAKFHSSSEEPALVRWLISTGIVKTAEQADGILIAIVAVALISTAVIFYIASPHGGHHTLTQEEKVKMGLAY